MSNKITCDFFRQTKYTNQTMFEKITCDFFRQAKYSIQSMFEIITCDFFRQTKHLILALFEIILFDIIWEEKYLTQTSKNPYKFTIFTMKTVLTSEKVDCVYFILKLPNILHSNYVRNNHMWLYY